ncbi:MAG: hypothetical protein V4604_05525 [Bacteroidota bacterium]
MQNGLLIIYSRNKLGLLLFLLVLMIIYSCNNSDKNNTIQENNTDAPDTLYYSENMRGEAGFTCKYDTLTVNNNIPRNSWVTMSVKGKGAMIDILKHSNIFIESDDTNFRVRKTGNTQFEIFISSKYSGYFPPHGGEYVSLFPVIQPHKDYVYKAYSGKPIVYPDRTRVMMLYEPIEEN